MLASESLIRLAREVRKNLEESTLEDNRAIAGSPENPCCPSCMELYNALILVEEEYGISPTK